MMKKITSLFVLLLTVAAAYGQTLTVTVTPTNPSTCNGTGSASVAVSGCAGPYTYTVDGGSPQTSPTSPFTIPNLAAGSHTVNVTTTGGGGTQTAFTDNFDGAQQWTLNTTIGFQDVESNIWIIDDEESWNGVCGSGNTVTTGDKTMHVYCNSQFCPFIGTGAIYDTGGGILSDTQTDKFSFTTNNISTTGLTNIHVKFGWRGVGQTDLDYAQLRYSINGGTNWIDLPTKYQGQDNWACADVTLPVTCENITTLKIAYRWINNNDGAGTDPTFAVDDVLVTGTGGGSACAGNATFSITGGSGTFTPTTNVTGTQAICDNEQLVITAVTGQNCTWNTTPQQSGPSITVTGPGTYACTCQDQSGNCSGTSAAVTVTLAPAPIGGFSYSQSSNYVLDFTSTSTVGTTFDWIFPNAPLTGTGATITHSFPAEGNYPVSLVVTSDCGVDTVTQTVVVLKVGIEENDIFSKFDLFPNPAQNQVMLQLNTVKPFVGTVKIVTPMGQIVSEEVVKFASTLNKTIATASLANGIYSIVVTTEGMTFARRLVINN